MKVVFYADGPENLTGLTDEVRRKIREYFQVEKDVIVHAKRTRGIESGVDWEEKLTKRSDVRAVVLVDVKNGAAMVLCWEVATGSHKIVKVYEFLDNALWDVTYLEESGRKNVLPL